MTVKRNPTEVAARGTFASPTTLTDSYVYSSVMGDGKGRDQIAILVKYTKGDETSMELICQFSDTNAFTEAFTPVYESVAGTGVASVLTHVKQWTASANNAIFLNSPGLYFRIGVKATGGTPTGTCAIKARFDTVSKGA